MNYEMMTKIELIKRLKFLESGIENVKRKETDPELRKSAEKTLEQCVLDRTNELSNSNKNLLKEIAKEQTEDKMRQYEHIVSCSTDMLAFIDKRFEYIAVNQAYSEAFKKTPEELIGHTVSESVGEDFFNTVIKSKAERALAGEEVHYQEWFKFPAYEQRYMEIVYYPYFDENNNVMGFVVNGRNITERKKADGLLREKEQQMRLFMLSTNDSIWNWDMVANTVERNIGFERAFGYETDEIQPGIEWWADRLHPDDKERVWKTFNDAVVGKQSTCRYEYRFRCRDGSYALIEDVACLIRDDTGKVVRSLGAMRDITERKMAEELLKGQKKALEQKNIALSEILGQIEIEKKQIKDNVLANAENLLLPIIQKLRLKGESRKYVQLLRKNLQELTSSFGVRVSDKTTKLTSREIELCNMIKNGLTNKEMAKLLSISLGTIERHRSNIRRKLRIVNKDINLSSVLKTL